MTTRTFPWRAVRLWTFRNSLIKARAEATRVVKNSPPRNPSSSTHDVKKSIRHHEVVSRRSEKNTTEKSEFDLFIFCILRFWPIPMKTRNVLFRLSRLLAKCVPWNLSHATIFGRRSKCEASEPVAAELGSIEFMRTIRAWAEEMKFIINLLFIVVLKLFAQWSGYVTERTVRTKDFRGLLHLLRHLNFIQPGFDFRQHEMIFFRVKTPMTRMTAFFIY